MEGTANEVLERGVRGGWSGRGSGQGAFGKPRGVVGHLGMEEPRQWRAEEQPLRHA